MAITEKYASEAGAGDHNGTSEAHAWTLAEAFANAAAGDRVNIKGNVTLGGAITPSNSGTAASPIIMRGYASSIGDGYLGRTNQTGALVATNMPVITMGGYSLTDSSKTLWVFESIAFTGAVSGSLIDPHASWSFIHCSIVNTQNNSSAVGAYEGMFLNCDVSATGASALCAIREPMLISNCRVTCPGGSGVYINAAVTQVHDSIFYSCVNGIKSVGAASFNSGIIKDTTFYACSAAAILGPNAAMARPLFVINVCATDSGRFLDSSYVATANNPVVCAGCRTRDNTNANQGWADWNTAFNMGAVTTDTGGAATDYVDAAGGDFRVIKDSPAIGAGYWGADIGGCQRLVDYPAAANVWTGTTYNAAGGGTGTAGTKVASSITNCEAGNVKKDVVIGDVTGTYEGVGGGSGPVPMIGSPFIRRVG